MVIENCGYKTVSIRWKEDFAAEAYLLYRSENGAGVQIYTGKDNYYLDTVRVPLNQQIYAYRLEKRMPDGTVKAETAKTHTDDWCEGLLPMPYLPYHGDWLELYRKVWKLAFEGIVYSDKLPFLYAYNDYPDNGTTYIWDSCFCSLFQRYAAPSHVHPCMTTLDTFYSTMTDSGYISRNFTLPGFGSVYSRTEPTLDSVNPPLFSMAEWEYYLISGDRARLSRVFPFLTAYFHFFENFLGEKENCYKWSGDGNGWDNINWREGNDAICYYVDAFGQQALAALMISKIAAELGMEKESCEYRNIWKAKKAAARGLYWNDRKSWYCSLTADGRFTRKTLCGMWPLFAGIASPAEAQAVKKVITDPNCFSTKFPLPTVARDEHGYNPRGEYWLGGVWINMDLIAIRALALYGFGGEEFSLSCRVLDGICRTYAGYRSFPRSLWETYAPEFFEPASHKVNFPDRTGGVREEFRGWTGNLVNILLENVMGFHADAPHNRLTWRIRLDEDHGIDNLRFGQITTSLRYQKEKSQISVVSDGSYHLSVRRNGSHVDIPVSSGSKTFLL